MNENTHFIVFNVSTIKLQLWSNWVTKFKFDCFFQEIWIIKINYEFKIHISISYHWSKFVQLPNCKLTPDTDYYC